MEVPVGKRRKQRLYNLLAKGVARETLSWPFEGKHRTLIASSLNFISTTTSLCCKSNVTCFHHPACPLHRERAARRRRTTVSMSCPPFSHTLPYLPTCSQRTLPLLHQSVSTTGRRYPHSFVVCGGSPRRISRHMPWNDNGGVWRFLRLAHFPSSLVSSR